MLYTARPLLQFPHAGTMREPGARGTAPSTHTIHQGRVSTTNTIAFSGLTVSFVTYMHTKETPPPLGHASLNTVQDGRI